jgi:hypothetical protein
MAGACNVFPFGLLCWAGTAIGQVNVAADCPEWEVPYGTGENDVIEVTPCWAAIESGLEYVRPVILFLWTLGLGFLFARATRAVGGD